MAAEEAQVASRHDNLARVLAIFSLLVSGATLFFSTLQSAHIEIGLGRYSMVNSRPRLGILCTLANTGARQEIIHSGTLHWDNPSADLQLAMVSTKLEEWTFASDGKKQVTSPTTYTVVSPIAIKGHDQATAILWFTSDKPLKFTEGSHSLLLKLNGKQGSVWEAPFSLDLSATQVGDISKNQFAEFPVEVATIPP